MEKRFHCGHCAEKFGRLYTTSTRSCTTHLRQIRGAQTDTVANMIVYRHHLFHKDSTRDITDSDAEQAMATSQEIDELNFSDSEKETGYYYNIHACKN